MSQQDQFIYLFFIFIAYTLSTPINSVSLTKKCNEGDTNCTLNQGPSSSFQLSSLYPTTVNTNIKHNSPRINLKLIAIIIAVVCLAIGIVRICFLLCNSSHSSNNPLPNRRRSTVRPQIVTIEQNQFKPDLPPNYTEAIANIDVNENKLPSYNELYNEQQSRTETTTQM